MAGVNPAADISAAKSESAWADRVQVAKLDRNEPQQFADNSFHRWYGFVLGYPDHLVSEILSTFSVVPGQVVADPFCGTGTTSIVCAKNRIRSIGIDANPFAVFAAQTKCSFHTDSESLYSAAQDTEQRYYKILESGETFASDLAYSYLNKSGMLARGWISPKPLRQALALRDAIRGEERLDIGNALMLALLADLPSKIGNMRFGPQIYKGKIKDDVDPIPYFRDRIKAMCDDLSDTAKTAMYENGYIALGDTRSCEKLFERMETIDYIICSPPYPTEHDYTRHMRLELAFTGSISTLNCLRRIKRTMIRSHTRGLYKGDDDASLAANVPGVIEIAKLIEAAVSDKNSKFEQFYPWVIRSYFGGMRRHFASIFPFLKSGAKAAYVVGDQAAYMRIPVKTALLLGEVAERVGFKVQEIKRWRRRWATGLSDFLDENILILEKP